jgi:FkbM family methyltransferase
VKITLKYYSTSRIANPLRLLPIYVNIQLMNPILRLAALASRILPVSLKQNIYRFKPLARLVRRTLNRAAPVELSQVKIAAGGLAGFTFELNLLTEKDYWLGTYEVELQQAVSELLKPGMCIYDVGANIGYVTLLLARAAGESGQVVAFEALPANVARLEKHVALNQLTGRVTIVPAAVVDQEGTAHFLVHPSTSMGKAGGSAGREKMADYVKEIEVPGLSLDGYIFERGHPPPQAIKMDIEGGEVLAIKGMGSILEEIRPLLLVELHGHEAARAVRKSLAQHRYTVHRMQPGYPQVNSVAQLDWKAYIIAKPIVENLSE